MQLLIAFFAFVMISNYLLYFATLEFKRKIYTNTKNRGL